MTASERTAGIPPLRERAREQSPMWFAFLGGAVAWAVRFGFSYMLVPVACQTGHVWILHAVALVTIAVAALAALVGYRGWVRARDRRREEGDRDDWDRDEFLGLAGLALSGFFALVIVLESSANFMVDPCLRAGVIGG